MPSSNAGETPQSTNATIVHSKQRQPSLYRIVPITLEVGFGPSSASYVITYNGNYNFTGKLDITAENETSNQHFFTRSILSETKTALLFFSRLLGSFCPVWHLILHLDLQGLIDTLPAQLYSTRLALSTVWPSAGEIYPLMSAKHVFQQQSKHSSKLMTQDLELGV